ncbi:MAG: hypothetical protein Harvfovirus30_15 [Harvfovirus sp.]|uniref:Uncharacterized protein n=1 Tax=Harvfovirus sp. TaxID=2487768 RepID=A0A3G5A6D2_9VIRU|nr:MAG: hypothetical protein Harvfovirus30_15 [Harvfovirus sp.]
MKDNNDACCVNSCGFASFNNCNIQIGILQNQIDKLRKGILFVDKEFREEIDGLQEQIYVLAARVSTLEIGSYAQFAMRAPTNPGTRLFRFIPASIPMPGPNLNITINLLDPTKINIAIAAVYRISIVTNLEFTTSPPASPRFLLNLMTINKDNKEVVLFSFTVVSQSFINGVTSGLFQTMEANTPILLRLIPEDENAHVIQDTGTIINFELIANGKKSPV